MTKEWIIPGEEDPEEMKLSYADGKFVLGWMAGYGDKKWIESELDTENFFDPDRNWYWYRVRAAETSRALRRILEEVTELMEPPREGASALCYQCYRHLREHEFEPYSITVGKVEVRISGDGVEYDYGPPRYAPDQPYIRREMAPDIFLLGSDVVIPELAQRRALRDHLRRQFAMPEAGFPLYDYSRLKGGNWQFNIKGPSGEFAEMQADRLTVGGWSNPRDGGARDITYERFVLSRREGRNVPPEIRAQIEAQLQAAETT